MNLFFWRKAAGRAAAPAMAALAQAGSRAPKLFVDFDGVLHPHQRGTLANLPLLEAFLRRHPSIEVVITSTWRMQHSLEELQEYFSEDLRHRVVGVVPFINRTPFSRFQEVQAYLAEQAPCRWAALDDEAHLFPPDCRNLVHTVAAEGVAARDLDAVARVLGLTA